MTPRSDWLGLLAMIGLAVVATGSRATRAAPLDLADLTPRVIEVRFEISPADQPGRLDAAWSIPRPGLLDATADPDRVRIRIPAPEIEAHLRSTGTAVIPGTFSDFVWILDRVTGHVLEARLEGRVQERLEIGFFTTRIAVDIRVDMSTAHDGGFRTTRAPFGIETHAFCSPTDGADACVAVETHRFDPRQGYVNAVGSIRAATPVAEFSAFSPLGEVRFSERAIESVGTSASKLSQPDAVFSPASAAHGGGEPGGWHDDSAKLSEELAAGRNG
jgi:hypothetical protein